MSLTTGHHLNQYQWTLIPKDRVHVLVCCSPLNPPGLIFADRNGPPLPTMMLTITWAANPMMTT